MRYFSAQMALLTNQKQYKSELGHHAVQYKKKVVLGK